jgi:hypothetical protein
VGGTLIVVDVVDGIVVLVLNSEVDVDVDENVDGIDK